MKLYAEMGFDAPVKKPTSKTEEELKSALQKYVIDNDREELTSRIEGILYLLERRKYKELIDPGNHTWAYRFIDAPNTSKMSMILRKPITPTSKVLSITSGVLYPDDRGLSSWTVNPRSLVYSGFFSVIPDNSHLTLVRAKVSANRFFGNPDELVSNLDFPPDHYAPGYALEREVVAVGPVNFESGVYCARDKDRSLEGQALDLIDRLDPLADKEIGDWNEQYYFPKL